jgi:FHA domain
VTPAWPGPAPVSGAPAITPAVSAPPPTTPIPSLASVTWAVLVAADRVYYDMRTAAPDLAPAAIAFPARVSERRIPLVGTQVRIGRRSTASEFKPEIDLAGPHADPGISRLHAVLVAAPDGTWSILDPGSANGTLLNGRQIAVGEPVTLHEGDRINLGAWTVITVHRG